MLNQKIALCSDIYRELDIPQQELHQKNLEEAVKALVDTTIPEFINLVNQRTHKPSNISDYSPDAEMHDRGINLRYLGIFTNISRTIPFKLTVL